MIAAMLNIKEMQRIAELEKELTAVRDELNDAYKVIKSAEALIPLVYIDADGEEKPRTWKEEAEELKSELEAAEEEIAELRRGGSR